MELKRVLWYILAQKSAVHRFVKGEKNQLPINLWFMFVLRQSINDQPSVQFPDFLKLEWSLIVWYRFWLNLLFLGSLLSIYVYDSIFLLVLFCGVLFVCFCVCFNDSGKFFSLIFSFQVHWNFFHFFHSLSVAPKKMQLINWYSIFFTVF